MVNGAKAFITNSGTDITSVVTVTARTGETADGKADATLFVTEAPKLSFARFEEQSLARLAQLAPDARVIARSACWSGTSRRWNRKRSGSPTSPRSRPRKASYTSVSSSICTASW